MSDSPALVKGISTPLQKDLTVETASLGYDRMLQQSLDSSDSPALVKGISTPQQKYLTVETASLAYGRTLQQSLDSSNPFALFKCINTPQQKDLTVATDSQGYGGTLQQRLDSSEQRQVIQGYGRTLPRSLDASGTRELEQRQDSSEMGELKQRQVTLLYRDKQVTFGWHVGSTAKAFGDQLRDAVRYITGRPSLKGMELLNCASEPSSTEVIHITPRDIFEGQVVRARVVVPEDLSSQFEENISVPSSAPQRVQDVDGKSAPHVRQKAEGKFQKKGGSQIEFMKMMSENKNPVAPLPPGVRLTVEEVARHRKMGNCWTIFQGSVYDITSYVEFHPGGKGEIMKGAGKDCTELYNKIHPWVSVEGLIGRLRLGKLEPSAAS